MFSQWLDNVAMYLECTYGAKLDELIECGQVRELQILFEGGVSEQRAADAIAKVCAL